jgi:hypothetical protein
MEDEAESVEEHLHGGGNVKRVVRGCKDDPIGRHHLFNEHVTVVLQRTELFTFGEAPFAAFANPKLKKLIFVFPIHQALREGRGSPGQWRTGSIL